MSTQDTNTPYGVAADAVAGAAAPSEQDIQSPEQLMTAAAERIAALEAERTTTRTAGSARRRRSPTCAPAPSATPTMPALRGPEIRPRRGGGGGEPQARPRIGAAADRGEPAIVTKLRDGFSGVERSFVGAAGTQRHQARGPDRRVVRPQPASGDGRARDRDASARHRVAGLDAGLDAERPAAAAGDGGGREGAGHRAAAGARRAAGASMDTTA